MSQLYDWPQAAGDAAAIPLWVLAAELEDSPAARRRRLAAKRRLLIDAGVILTSDGSEVALSLQGQGRSCPLPYGGTSPTGGQSAGA
jgi:hypothetical protein